jgi:hypothetical protein
MTAERHDQLDAKTMNLIGGFVLQAKVLAEHGRSPWHTTNFKLPLTRPVDILISPLRGCL